MTQLHQLHQDSEKQHNLKERADALSRLMLNNDFKKLIIDGYLKEYALDLIYSNRYDINATKYERLDSIKFFKDYLDLVENQGLTAEQSIREINEELENLLTENLEE